MKKFRPIAVHLPQFHPIPENDEWWGKGFTEWTNVAKATPKFKNHYQPHLPSDLGFYDLRLEEARLEQEKLAKEYGIYGFCYYHYWFNGKTLLHEPIERKLNNAKEDFPFMLCWANENWTRIWDGGENNILMEQKYNMDDHLLHLQYLIPFFKDERYIRIDGKPVFAIYRTTNIPEIEKVIELWQKELKKEGLEMYFIRFESFNESGPQFLTPSMDAATEFQPHTVNHLRNKQKRELEIEQKKNFKTLKDEINITTLKNSFNTRIYNKLRRILKIKESESAEKGSIIEYAELVDLDVAASKEKKEYKVFPCVCPGFDNTARKSSNYLILNNSTPDKFQYWMEKKVQNFQPLSIEENLFFINAWNEWAEGNHLEPDRKWGRKYLEAVRNVFGK